MMVLAEQGKKDRRVFYWHLFLLLSLCVIRYSFQVNIPQELLLVVAVLMALWGDRDEIIATCMCCIPLYTTFEYNYAVLIGIVIYVLKFGKTIRFTMAIIPVFLIVLWETLHCFGQEFVVVQYVARLVPLLMLVLLMSSRCSKLDYALIVRVFSISAVAMCLSAFGKILFAANFDFWLALTNLQRLGMETEELASDLLVEGAAMNPNSLGIICVLGMTGLQQLRAMNQKRKSDTFLLLVLLLFGVTTASRTFLVCLILMAVLLLFSQKGNVGKKIKFLCGLIAIALVALLLLSWVAPTILEYFSSRFQTKDLTTGRIDLMGIYHEYIMSNNHVLFMGIGLHELGNKLVYLYQIASLYPHNAIQELIIAWGLPGGFLMIALGFVMVRSSRKVCIHQGLINYIPVFLVLVKSMAGQLIGSEYTMLSLSFAYLSMCTWLTPEARTAIAEVNEEKDDRTDGIMFGDAVAALWKNKLKIVSVTMAFAVLGFVISSKLITPVYQSSVLLYVNNNSIATDSLTRVFTSNDIYASRSLAGTYSVILKSRQSLDRVAEFAQIDKPYEELRDMIIVRPADETEILEVSVRSTDRDEAETVANAIATVIPDQIAGIIEGTSARIVDYAVVASSPVSPNKTTDTMISFFFGLELIVLILLLRAMKDTTIREESAITAQFQYPVLAAIPKLSEEKNSSRKRKKSS